MDDRIGFPFFDKSVRLYHMANGKILFMEYAGKRIERKRMKTWKHILRTGLLSISMLVQSFAVLASDCIIKNGDFHIEQFGKYDILVEVETKDNLISNVKITGDNFSGTHADVNQQKLSQAADGIREKLKGISASDAKKIMEIDTVSGATISSNGIKRAVLDALDLKEESDTTGTLEKVPKAGEYEVAISVKSDVVEHSMLGTEKATAKLNVDKNGKMKISYRMVSGTEKEPMYILAFNGYYPNNDRQGSLTMEDASVGTETKNGHTIATEVSFPLCDLSGTYYANSKIYVPAMKNLNGLISGVSFENGTFDVDNIVTVDWNTLKNTDDHADNRVENSMDVTATIEEEMDSPQYSVVIPSAVWMGDISASKDNVREYELTVRTEDKNGAIVVSAPAEGELRKKENAGSTNEYLKFTNDFGKQTVRANGKQKESLATKHCLTGKINIAAKDVEKVSAGTYSGTTVFTINYEKEGEETPGKRLDSNSNPEPEKKLEDGVYSITGSMVKTDKITASMSDAAIHHTIKLTVKNGKYDITLNFNGLKVGEKLGYLSQLKYFMTGYTMDSRGNLKGTLADVTIDSYQKNKDGSIVSDQYGTNYPDEVSFELIPEALTDGYVPLQVFVPIMASISTDAGTQPVFLKLDWSSIKRTTLDDPDFNKNDNNNSDNNNNSNNNVSSPGNNSLGKNTLGGGSLGGSKLGSSSLGNGSSGLKSGKSNLGGGLGSSLKSAASVKTGDILQDNVLWLTILFLGGVAFLAGWSTKRRSTTSKRK